MAWKLHFIEKYKANPGEYVQLAGWCTSICSKISWCSFHVCVTRMKKNNVVHFDQRNAMPWSWRCQRINFIDWIGFQCSYYSFRRATFDWEYSLMIFLVWAPYVLLHVERLNENQHNHHDLFGCMLMSERINMELIRMCIYNVYIYLIIIIIIIKLSNEKENTFENVCFVSLANFRFASIYI